MHFPSLLLIAHAVGLCLAEQFLPSTQIPTSEHDWRVDAVAVGDGKLVTSQSV